MLDIPRNPVVRSLRRQLEKAAGLLRGSIDEGRPVVIRFNNDSDGISAGLLVQRALQHYVQQKGATRAVVLVRSGQANGANYTLQAAEEDALLCRELGRKTMLACLDFAGNEDSVPGLRSARNSGIKALVLDHHPCDIAAVQAACELFVTPHAFAEKHSASQYTAGMLAFLLLEFFKKPDSFEERLLATSLYADVSAFAFGGKPPSEEEMLHAMMSGRIPEWLALYRHAQGTPDGTPLEHYSKALSDPARVTRLHENAVLGLKRAIARANELQKVKILDNGIEVHSVNVQKVVPKGKWPSRSIFTTAWALSAGSGKPVVSLAWNEERIAFRANSKAREHGFDAAKIIRQLKEEFPADVASGGGHAAAAAMNYNVARVQEILQRIEELAAGLRAPAKRSTHA